MTMEELLSSLQAILDAARNEDGTERPLNEEEVGQVESLERSIEAHRKSAEIVSRQAARTQVQGPKFNASSAKPDTYERAFEAYLRTGQRNSDLIHRAQNEAVGSAGGFLVPESWKMEIIEKRLAFGGLQAAADSVSTSTGAPLSWLTNDEAPTTSTAGDFAEITPEAGAFDVGADLAFGTRTLGAYKYTTVGASNLPLKVSYELLQDTEFDLKSFISRKFANRIARKLSRDLILGTGVNEPQGIISTQGGIASGTARAAAAPTYAELLAVVHGLDPEYRDGASWLFNDATLALVRGVVDGAQRPLLWNSNEDLSQALKGMSLMGFPVVVDQAMPTSTDASANKSIVFGNLKDAYIVREVKSFEMVVLNELYAVNGQVGFMGWARYDGMVQDPNAAIISPND